MLQIFISFMQVEVSHSTDIFQTLTRILFTCKLSLLLIFLLVIFHFLMLFPNHSSPWNLLRLILSQPLNNTTRFVCGDLSKPNFPSLSFLFGKRRRKHIPKKLSSVSSKNNVFRVKVLFSIFFHVKSHHIVKLNFYLQEKFSLSHCYWAFLQDTSEWASTTMMAENRQISVARGFRFYPADEELLYYYLRKKVSYEAIDFDVIKEVDLYKFEPWDLKV